MLVSQSILVSSKLKLVTDMIWSESVSISKGDKHDSVVYIAVGYLRYIYIYMIDNTSS